MAAAEHVPRQSGIQVLRGLAAVWVLLFHMSMLAPSQSAVAGESIPATFVGLGFAGVDIFFVLSGFVMWYSSSHHAVVVNPWQFLGKRFARIYLGYWPCLLVSAVVYAFWWPAALEGRGLIKNLLLLDKNITALVIGQAWSLVYELYFYLMFFVLLFLPSSRRLGTVLAMYIVVLMANYLGWRSGSAVLSSDASLSNVFLSPLVCEFLSGALLAAFSLRWNSHTDAIKLLLTGVFVTVASSWYAISAVQSQGLAFVNVEFFRVLSFGLAALGIVAIATAAGTLGVRWNSQLVTLGDQSFSLYLLHFLIVQIATASGLFAACGGRQFSTALCWAVVILGTISVTYLYYRFVEYPLYQTARRKIDRWASPGLST
jgi:exopolysaccharide production protein ExoZ